MGGEASEVEQHFYFASVASAKVHFAFVLNCFCMASLRHYSSASEHWTVSGRWLCMAVHSVHKWAPFFIDFHTEQQVMFRVCVCPVSLCLLPLHCTRYVARIYLWFRVMCACVLPTILTQINHTYTLTHTPDARRLLCAKINLKNLMSSIATAQHPNGR